MPSVFRSQKSSILKAPPVCPCASKNDESVKHKRNAAAAMQLLRHVVFPPGSIEVQNKVSTPFIGSASNAFISSKGARRICSSAFVEQLPRRIQMILGGNPSRTHNSLKSA